MALVRARDLREKPRNETVGLTGAAQCASIRGMPDKH